MFTEKIGNNAGLVWAVLENGEVEVKVLKKETNLIYNDLYAALGWLAREDKLNFREEGKDLFISLA